MAILLIYNSPIFDFVNGSTPRSIAIYTVPSNLLFILDSIDIIPIATNDANEYGYESIDLEIGNQSDAAAYQQTYQQGTWSGFQASPTAPQIATSGTEIIATIINNSTAISQTGIILLRGYLIPSTGTISNPPTAPVPTGFVGTFFTVDTGQNVVGSIPLTYQQIGAPDGSGFSFDATEHSITSDEATGLVEIPMTPGATYTISGGTGYAPIITIPIDAVSPYVLPNFTYNN